MAIGAAAGIGLALELHSPPVMSGAVVLASVLGGLVPDIDSNPLNGGGAKIAHLFYRSAPLAALAYLGLGAQVPTGDVNTWLHTRVTQAVVIALLVAAFPVVAGLLLPHRGPTHSVVVWLIILGACLVFMPEGLARAISVAVCVGTIVGGILPDAATPSGVPALWPFRNEHLHVLPPRCRIRTGGLFELLVVMPAAYLAVLYLAYRLCLITVHQLRPALPLWR